MEIGDIHEKLENYSAAAAAYSEALEWRSQVSDASGIFSLAQLKELTANYKSLARIHVLAKEPKQAIATLNEILSILNARIEDGLPADVPGYAIEAVRVMLQLGEYEYTAGEISAASSTYQELTVLAKSLANRPPEHRGGAGLAYLASLRALGTIQLDQKQPEAALVLFREEIKIREQQVGLRPMTRQRKSPSPKPIPEPPPVSIPPWKARVPSPFFISSRPSP